MGMCTYLEYRGDGWRYPPPFPLIVLLCIRSKGIWQVPLPPRLLTLTFAGDGRAPAATALALVLGVLPATGIVAGESALLLNRPSGYLVQLEVDSNRWMLRKDCCNRLSLGALCRFQPVK